jgi:hypothetical protein
MTTRLLVVNILSPFCGCTGVGEAFHAGKFRACSLFVIEINAAHLQEMVVLLSVVKSLLTSTVIWRLCYPKTLAARMTKANFLSISASVAASRTYFKIDGPSATLASTHGRRHNPSEHVESERTRIAK